MLSLGCEIEFQVEGTQPKSDTFTIHNEFYSGQYEINSFLVRAATVPDLVTKLQAHVLNVLDELKTYDPRYVYAVPIHRGLAFCGVHLHIQDTDHIPENAAQWSRVSSRIGSAVVSSIERHSGLSARQVFSHHIWGNYRRSSSSWKESSRFKPCLFNTTHSTYELRVIDFEQLLPANKGGLTRLLKCAFSGIKCEPRDVNNTLINVLRGAHSDMLSDNVHDDDDVHDDDGHHSTPYDLYLRLKIIDADLTFEVSMDDDRRIRIDMEEVRSLRSFDLQRSDVSYVLDAGSSSVRRVVNYNQTSGVRCIDVGDRIQRSIAIIQRSIAIIQRSTNDRPDSIRALMQQRDIGATGIMESLAKQNDAFFSVQDYFVTGPINTTTLPIDTTTLPIDTTTLPIDTTTLPIDTTTLPIDTMNRNLIIVEEFRIQLKAALYLSEMKRLLKVDTCDTPLQHAYHITHTETTARMSSALLHRRRMYDTTRILTQIEQHQGITAERDLASRTQLTTSSIRINTAVDQCIRDTHMAESIARTATTDTTHIASGVYPVYCLINTNEGHTMFGDTSTMIMALRGMMSARNITVGAGQAVGCGVVLGHVGED